MRKTLIVLAAGGAALAGIVAWSGASLAQRAFGPGFGGPGFGMASGIAAEILRDIDADRDGRLTQAEIDGAVGGRYARFDADKNGALSLDEFTGLFAEFTRPVTVRAFQLLDANGDASLARAEADDRFGRAVQRFDRNGDGALSPDDRPRRGGSGGPDRN